ncbi:hypothetical protein [Nocardioides campestrisoli]|uniref:hypothetical protein n=1 Tax=Nocardioides campestrisoli TaxID=2736757 RepID=UPI0015E648D3|nr:hypothetical protein [Nocardioides campestrisoli]
MSAVLRLLLSLALGVAAGSGVLRLLHGEDLDVSTRVGPVEPGDRVRDAVAGVADDRVHVSADGRAMLDEEGEAAVAAALAERDLPVHVVVWRHSMDAGYDHYIEAAEQIVAELDEPSLVVLWQGPEDSHAEATEGWTAVYRTDETGSVSPEPDYLGDARKRLLEWIEQLPDEPLRRLDD